MSRETTPTENVVAGEPGLLQEARDFAKASPRGPMGRVVSHLLALIESQRASIERVRTAVGGFAKPTGGDLVAAVDLISMRCAAAEARVTALEAEKAKAIHALDLALDSDRQADIREAIAIRAALSRSTEKNDGA